MFERNLDAMSKATTDTGFLCGELNSEIKTIINRWLVKYSLPSAGQNGK